SRDSHQSSPCSIATEVCPARIGRLVLPSGAGSCEPRASMPPVMRGSNQRARGTLALASLFVLSAILAACGSTPPASVAPPPAQPTPGLTPGPPPPGPV